MRIPAIIKTTTGLVVIGALLLVIPVWFWYTFVRTVPVGQDGTATIATRFDGETPELVAGVEQSARMRELLPYPSTALSYDRRGRTLRMYEEGTGRVFEVNPQTLHVQALSESRLDDFINTLWSPNGHEVISTFTNDGATEYRYYDYLSGRFATLHATTTHVAFSPDGTRIVSARNTGSSVDLWVSLPDGTDEWRLFSSRLTVDNLGWPQNDAVAIVSERPDGRRDLSLVSTQGALTMLLEKRALQDVRWSPDGILALVTEEHADAMHTSILNTLTSAETALGKGIRASKCAWNTRSDTVTCGIADYGEMARSGSDSLSRHDTIVIFDILLGTSDVRYEPPSDVFLSVTTPIMLPSGSDIAFINLFDKKPYLISW